MRVMSSASLLNCLIQLDVKRVHGLEGSISSPLKMLSMIESNRYRHMSGMTIELQAWGQRVSTNETT